MRVLFVWQYYSNYIRSFYARYRELAWRPYHEQLSILLDDYFSWPGYFVRALRYLGHEADIILANIYPLQFSWAKEHSAQSFDQNQPHLLLEQQIKRFKPDVLFLGPWYLNQSDLFKRVRASCGRIFVWIASPLRVNPAVEWIDCILTSFPHFVRQFQQQGVYSTIFQPACFDPEIIEVISNIERDIPVSFIGGLSPANFKRRLDILNHVARCVPLQVWGYGLFGRLSRHPIGLMKQAVSQFRMRRLKDVYKGEIYGLDMFRIMSRSRITINVHIDVAEGVASNIRLFEATGCGALLLTEASPNLSSIFKPETEVVTYTSRDELIDKIKYYSNHDTKREIISIAGQNRTLTSHNAKVRTQELLDLFERCPV